MSNIKTLNLMVPLREPFLDGWRSPWETAGLHSGVHSWLISVTAGSRGTKWVASTIDCKVEQGFIISKETGEVLFDPFFPAL